MHSLAVFAGMCHSYRCLPNVWVVHHYTSSFTRPHALPHVNTASNKHWLLVDLDGCYANSTLFSPIVQLVAFSKSWPPLLWLYITRLLSPLFVQSLELEDCVRSRRLVQLTESCAGVHGKPTWLVVLCSS